MIIWLDDGLFRRGSARRLVLVALFRTLYARRHSVVISTRPGLHGEAPGFDAWRRALPSDIAESLGHLIEGVCRPTASIVTRGAGRLFVSDAPPPDGFAGCWLSLDDAGMAAALPLCVVVENLINDAIFLRVALPPVWQRRLAEWERTGQLRFVQGGGLGNMTPMVERFARDEDYTRLSWGLPPSAWRALHFIICDRDAGPDDHGKGVRKLLKACEAGGMRDRLHVLKRRCQESYLPMQALRRLDDDAGTSKIHGVPGGQARHHHEVVTEKPFKGGFRRLHDQRSFRFEPAWFREDGSWEEMVEIAEKLASAL